MSESRLLLTFPPCAPGQLAADADENVMEKWGFKQYRRIASAALAHRAMLDEQYPAATASSSAAASVAAAAPAPSQSESLHRLCALVVDSGFSFTHVMPVYQGRMMQDAVKR